VAVTWVTVESSKVIDLERFVPRGDIDVMAALERSLAQEMPLTGAMTAEEKRPKPAADRHQGALGRDHR
jgi:hypothetical protein